MNSPKNISKKQRPLTKPQTKQQQNRKNASATSRFSTWVEQDIDERCFILSSN